MNTVAHLKFQCRVFVSPRAVSAIYFESADKQMYVEGSIWTKSKFLGMSIGVVMVGKGQWLVILF